MEPPEPLTATPLAKYRKNAQISQLTETRDVENHLKTLLSGATSSEFASTNHARCFPVVIVAIYYPQRYYLLTYFFCENFLSRWIRNSGGTLVDVFTFLNYRLLVVTIDISHSLATLTTDIVTKVYDLHLNIIIVKIIYYIKNKKF